MLLKIFRNFFSRFSLNTEDRYLVAVSGGKDSMALLDLFYTENMNVEVAHVNFQLRGEEALADEDLVRTYCRERQLTFHVVRFDTKAYAEEHGISTQMAARDLRYTWFKTLLLERQLKYVALAHHRQDNMETFLLNWTKGTGPKGLLGIPERSEWLLRPLLHADPKDIISYMQEKNLPWREDASNLDTHYQRNRIRHKVLPALKEINPGLEHTFDQNQDRFHQLYAIYSAAEDNFKSHLVSENDDVILPDSVLLLPGGKLLLEEFLKPYHFTPAQVNTAFSGIEKGKSLFSPSHRLVREKEGWRLQLAHDELSIDLKIHNPGSYETALGTLDISENFEEKLDFRNPLKVYMDADRVQWPLGIRTKKTGDRFQPFGMKGSKLVSDFLKDSPLNYREKQQQLLLEDREKILWLLGHRISEKVKIRPETKRVLCFTFRKIN